MPNRMLRDWTDSLKFDGISADAERLFVRLIMKADDYGRFHAEPRLIKASCFPLIENLRPNDLTRWLDELSTRQLILRYETDGRNCLAIVNYGQRLKKSRAKFPPMDGKEPDWLPCSDMFPELPGTSRNFPPEEKRREEEGNGREGGDAADPPKPLCTIEQAVSYAPMCSLTPDEAKHWWHTRNASGWTKGSSNGTARRITSWQSDMATAKAWVSESLAKSKAAAPKKEIRFID